MVASTITEISLSNRNEDAFKNTEVRSRSMMFILVRQSKVQNK